jgi:hypothetical protein
MQRIQRKVRVARGVCRSPRLGSGRSWGQAEGTPLEKKEGAMVVIT